MSESVRHVTIRFRRETYEVTAGMTARDAILKCHLNPETLLVVRNGELVTDDIKLNPGDNIKLVATISGG